MIISFDLDDLLIPGVKTFDTEKVSFFQKVFGIEAIRLGSPELFKELESQGHVIYIYTTSFRSVIKIKLMFLSYGITVGKVINQKVHNLILREQKNRTSKYPPAFGIDIHIDDSTGVKIEGEKYNFHTIIIDENDNNWRRTVIEGVKGEIGRCSF